MPDNYSTTSTSSSDTTSSVDPNTNLPDGTLLENRWRIVSKLGEGGFGSVYKVAHVTTDEEYAMKVESMKEKASMIKMEVAILKTFQNTFSIRMHACTYLEAGQTVGFRYLVMQLVGSNLSDLRLSRPDRRFRGCTTALLAIQCLEAVESLHRIGYLHRDIKPANFAIGCRPDDNRHVYLLDYGMARQYVDRNGKLRPERSGVGFRGTVKYVSPAGHARRDLGRCDDLWGLFYMLIEMRRGYLPWRHIDNKHQVAKMKNEIELDCLLEGMEVEFYRVHFELQRLRFADTPNYSFLRQLFKTIIERKKYIIDHPFEWQTSTVEEVTQ